MSYTVRARHLHGGHARPVDEPTAEAAAVAYLEDFGHDADEDEAVSLIVRDNATGREQCFRVDLTTGRTEPCG
ncbi:DUF5961 family protein [Caulobacter segnis]|uniref:Uncharacterized protein n=1 Tax=Caulobacter segnis TaxID=88688 RepID=A0A2W5UZH9_9CAUL|nr:DUF5961 family protein [Caulobacter segnis]PZR32412.1 MAG: hypothetical protein DI526_16715 [Caulobacter segnis]